MTVQKYYYPQPPLINAFPGRNNVLGIVGTGDPDWIAGGLVRQLPVGYGNVYYVNGGSDGPLNDNGDGFAPLTPKRTVKAAIDLCEDNHNDCIVVLNYGGNARAVETFPIALNKDLVHIIGVATESNKWPVVSVLAPAGADIAKPAFLVTGQRCSMSGLELGGGNTAGCVHVSTVGGGVWGFYLNNCFLGWTGDGVGQDGVRVVAGADAPFLTIEACMFGTYLTRDGVRIDGNATRCVIGLPGRPSNMFRRVPGISINLPGAVASPSILNNIMALPSNTAGKGITLGAGVAGGFIHGNYANFGDTEMANNPYSDGAAGGANDWLLNYKAITALMPA